MARPSKPSVKLTAFELPTITNTRNRTKGTNAKGHTKLRTSSQSITKLGCKRLKNGTLNCVEYAPCDCSTSNATPTATQVNSCKRNFFFGDSPRLRRRTTLL